VGPGFLEGLQTPDRVVEIGSAVEEILRARGEHECEWSRASRLRGGGDALGRVAERVDRLRGIAGCVLDRAAGEARLRGAPDRLRGGFRRIAESLLEIRRHRELRRLRDGAAVGDRLLARHMAVAAPE